MGTETVKWSESSNQKKTIAAEQVIVTRKIKFKRARLSQGQSRKDYDLNKAVWGRNVMTVLKVYEFYQKRLRSPCDGLKSLQTSTLAKGLIERALSVSEETVSREDDDSWEKKE